MLSKYLAVPDTQTVCQNAFNIPVIEKLMLNRTGATCTRYVNKVDCCVNQTFFENIDKIMTKHIFQHSSRSYFKLMIIHGF